MVEINEWLLETLYALKKLYDHGKADGIVALYESNISSRMFPRRNTSCWPR